MFTIPQQIAKYSVAYNDARVRLAGEKALGCSAQRECELSCEQWLAGERFRYIVRHTAAAAAWAVTRGHADVVSEVAYTRAADADFYLTSNPRSRG